MTSKKIPGHNTPSAQKEITRRDFIGGTLVGSGTALLMAPAPGLLASERKPYALSKGHTMPVPLNDLDESWSGPGGIGDYQTANGNTHKVVNAAHTFRNGDFAERVNGANNIGEVYDLVCVGGGFSGVTTAYTYLKANPDAKILIIDNHDMFGGEARHNEFEVDGHKALLVLFGRWKKPRR